MILKNCILKSYAILFCVFYSNIIIAQNPTVTVTGKILSHQHEPVDFASVWLKGSNISTTTDEKGIFTLSVPIGSSELRISGVGFKEKNIVINATKEKPIHLDDIVLISTSTLDEVLVSGKTEKRKIQETGLNAAVIELKNTYNYSGDLSKVINRVTGVRIREEGGMGSDYNFMLNGFSGKQVKFFLDGIPMDNFGSSLGLNNLSSSFAERVEIYKGVIPVNLGADALGGAVNIISRKSANYLDASYSIGSFNTHQAAVNGAYTHDNTGFTVRANAYYNYSDNNYKVYAPVLDFSTDEEGPYQWVKRFHDNYKSFGVKLETGITGKSYADYLLAGIILSGNDKDIQTGTTMEKVFGAMTTNSQSVIPSIRYKKSDLFINGLDFTLYGAYNFSNYNFTDTTARKYNWLGEWVAKESASAGEWKRTQYNNKNKEWLANANLNYALNPQMDITLNYVFSNLNRKSSDKEDPGNIEYQMPQSMEKQVAGLGWMAKYFRWNATVFTKLYQIKAESYKQVDWGTPTARLEEVTQQTAKPGFGAAAAYFILPSLQVKLSYEHAYRLPEIVEFFGDGLFGVSNPDLQPEKSDNINAGITYGLKISNNHKFSIESNFLYRNTSDFIKKELGSNSMSSKYINLGKVRTIGTEASLRYDWKNMLHAGANVTYQNITDREEYTTITNSQGSITTKNPGYKSKLPNIPYLFGNAEAGIQLPDILFKKSQFTLDYSLNYIHEYYYSWPNLGTQSTKSFIPEQLSHNVSIGYSLQNGKYNIVLECINLTDEMLYDNFLLQKPGRAFSLKFRYAFNK